MSSYTIRKHTSKGSKEINFNKNYALACRNMLIISGKLLKGEFIELIETEPKERVLKTMKSGKN